ncbi:MAG: HAMP domain-containing histidine kinase [Ruminococcaceae bacterium]|nr:HAMP domain-containing histidine kinase [Oscillospiraceae bacterium]
MIQKLRWKIVAINLLFVTAVLLAIFGGVYMTSRASLVQRSEQELHKALRGDLNYDPMRPGQESAQPCFIADIYRDGTARVSGSSYYRLDDEALIMELIRDCMEREESAGLLEEYSLRYLRSDGPLYTRIAFTDSTVEQDTLRALVRSSLLIGAAALLVLTFCSYLLAGLATRPVEKAWREQQQFLSDASHELKTPLTVILSSAELLAEQQPAGENGRYLENIREESGRMKRLVDSMLTLARTESGQGMAEPVPVNLSELAMDTALTFEAVAYEAGQKLVCHVAPDLQVLGQPDQLRQVMSVLLDNAIKYAPAGEEITLSLQRTERNALLQVSNPGRPIPPEQLEHLFDRFYRADESRSRQEGFGLGLPIARSIVQALHGTIRCQSDQQATRFQVMLPLQR